MKVSSFEVEPLHRYVKRGKRVGSHENETFSGVLETYSASLLVSMTYGALPILIKHMHGREAANPCRARF
ncbi:hypothetical protein HYX09_06175 [Candidatus Woesearchaeota archaeon]|nr:hypothetical protein [Candidatus Woesearchaeota archaeon]